MSVQLRYVGLAVTVALLASSIASRCTAQQTDTTFGYFVQGAQPLIVVRDSIGVYAPGANGASAVLAVVATWGGHAPRDMGKGLYVVALPIAVTRAQLAERARNAIALSGGVIKQAGFLVRGVSANNRGSIIVSDRFIVEFRVGVTRAQIDSLNVLYHVNVLTPLGLLKNDYLLTVTPGSPGDALQIANIYHESGLAVFAHPNYLDGLSESAVIPDDPLFPDQWHLHNTGAHGIAGADIHAPEAWDVTLGASSTVIAILEPYGFNFLHPDLFPNLWINPGEIDGNGADETDGWVKADDVHGWNFDGCTDVVAVAPTSTCGTPAWRGTKLSHGTSVAGLAAARGGNGIGVSGVCPRCSLMLITIGSDDVSIAAAIRYAYEMGASIINMSWSNKVATFPYTAAQIANATTLGRGGKGTVVVGSASEENDDLCSVRTFGLQNVIAVTGSDDYDRRASRSGFGECIDIMAPGWMRNVAPLVKSKDGTATFAHVTGIVTTDSMGAGGVNSEERPYIGCALPEPAQLEYTRCFSGTSAAAPMVAGVAGLILSVNPSLTVDQVKAILYKTADRIEYDATLCPSSTANPAGYSPACPITDASWSQTHGNGRVNAFAAVKAATSIGASGSCLTCPASTSWEIGVRSGVTVQSDAVTRTTMSVPGAGPLAAPTLYVTWFPTNLTMLEVHFGGFNKTGGSTPAERELNAALQGGYRYHVGAGELYAAGNLALRQTQTSPYPSVTETGVGAAIGFRYKPEPYLALRVEALGRRWTGLSVNEAGLAFAFGVVF